MARGGSRKLSTWLKRIVPAFAVVLVVLVAVYVARWMDIRRTEGMSQVFQLLSAQGYVPNVGFSGNYQPGNILRITEQGPDGKSRPLPTPVVFKWASDCFPGRKPRSEQFLVPDAQGSSSASIILGADEISRLLPSLKVDSRAASSYSIKLKETQVHTLASGDLSGAFADGCVKSLARAIESGDKPEWFAVVLEAIVAAGLSMEVQWRSDTDANARVSFTEAAQNALSQLSAGGGQDKQGVSVGIKTEDQQRTVLSTDKPVVVAYRIRPIQPSYAN